MKTLSVPRVLVVEDEPDIAALVAYQLTREGYRVETAGTGREALEAVGRDIPDLVVLDRMLPDVSGDDVLQTRTVDMHIRRLRSKLGEVGDWIETIRGFGYRLKVPEGTP